MIFFSTYKRICILLFLSVLLLGNSFSGNKKAGVSPPLLFGIKTVVIDPGHGGKDPGCIGTKHQEKNITLAIALKLGKYIEEKMPDVKVIYTRKTDVSIGLDERAAIANKNKADLFISIHCNASEKKEPHGSETYVMGLHKTKANLDVAKRENAAILLEKNYQKRYDGFDPNSETSYILLTMQQNAYLKQSLNFASKIQKQMREKVGRVDKGVHQMGFLVLWRSSMPSVLIETEFLTNPQAEKFLGSEKGQDNFARSIFAAFREYKDEIEGKLAKYDDDIEKTTPLVQENDTTEINGEKDRGEIKEVKNQEQENNKQDSSTEKKEPVVQYTEIIGVVARDSSLLVKTDLPPAKIDSVKPEVKKEPVSSIAGGALVYKVQFMFSSKRIPLLSDKFKGLKEVGEYEDNGSYKYTSGEFKTVSEAMNHRIQMQAKGYKDCFVVKFKDGKRLKN